MRALLLIVLFKSITLDSFAQLPEFFSYDRNGIALNQENPTLFKVFRGSIESLHLANKAQTLGGSFIRSANSIRFKPLVPFDWDTNYTILYQESLYSFSIKIPEDYERLEVVSVYPNAKEVPSNILKWYVSFSKPINSTNVYNHFKIMDSDGLEINRAILDLNSPLLSKDGQLLTIWIEPGRQKRDLGPNQQLGSVFKANNDYILQILQSLKDVNGVTMETHFEHHFKTTAADRKKPQLSNWSITIPKAQTKESLRIHCTDIIDYGSLINHTVILKDGNPIQGNVYFNYDNNTIIFKSLKLWNKGYYTVLFNSKLEDISGNNLKRLFDEDSQNNSQEDYLTSLNFTID